MWLFIYYIHDKIAFFKIQLHFVKSFQQFCKQFGISKLGNDKKTHKGTQLKLEHVIQTQTTYFRVRKSL
jgi:hypothetical protein